MKRSDHRKYARPILIICAHLLICVPVFAQSHISAQIRQSGNNRAYQKLLHANVFNLGGVGYGQAITAEEQAFKKLLTSIDSTSVFQRLIREANGEGQLYALLGLHLLAPIFSRLKPRSSERMADLLSALRISPQSEKERSALRTDASFFSRTDKQLSNKLRKAPGTLAF